MIKAGVTVAEEFRGIAKGGGRLDGAWAWAPIMQARATTAIMAIMAMSP